MTRIRLGIVAAAISLLALMAPPAHASHTCGLDGVPIVGPVCDGYHSPKLVVQYLVYCAQYPNSCL